MTEQQVSLNDYMRMLYRGRWIILFSFIVVVAATAYITFTTQPVFEASVLVQLKQDGGVQRQIFEVSSFMKQETRINNNVEILKSYTLAEEVMRRLKASEHADSLWILGRRNDEAAGHSIKSRILSLLGLKPEEEKEPTLEDLADHFRERSVSVAPKRDTDMIELKATSFSPFEASLLVNTWAAAYREQDIEVSRGEVMEVRMFLDEKLEGLMAELRDAENALTEFKQTNQVVELDAETQQLIQQAANFQAQFQEARTGLEANEKRLEFLRKQLDANQRVLVDEATSLTSSVILQLQTQMADLIAQKASYEQQLKSTDWYTKDDPKLAQMDQRLKGLQEKISEEIRRMVAGGAGMMNPMGATEKLLSQIIDVESENKALSIKTQELQKIVRQYDRMLNRLPGKSLQLARLQREAEVNNKIFVMLREKYEENRIVEAGQLGSVRIVDWAKPPKKPIKPKKKMNLMLGIMAGLGLGVGITFLREYLDTSLKSLEDVERLGFAVLGSIPFISSQKAGTKANGHNGEARRIESRLVTHFAPKSPISEAYRTVRTNIQYAKAGSQVRTVLVTSSGPGEGKSTTVANLAITFAQMGARTLLIDTDLRRPVLHGIFGQTRNEGLTNILVGRTSLKDAMKPTRIDDLFLLTSGTLPPNPSELLNSKMMEEFLEESKAQFDMVLLDTPPVIAVTDAAVLSTKVDGVVLVTLSGKTGRDVLVRARGLLDKVAAHLLGVLVNGVKTSHMYGSYYQYYEYYYASESRDKKGGRAGKGFG